MGAGETVFKGCFITVIPSEKRLGQNLAIPEPPGNARWRLAKLPLHQISELAKTSRSRKSSIFYFKNSVLAGPSHARPLHPLSSIPCYPAPIFSIPRSPQPVSSIPRPPQPASSFSCSPRPFHPFPALPSPSQLLVVLSVPGSSFLAVK